MIWTEPKTTAFGFAEVFCETPLGKLAIEWSVIGDYDKFLLYNFDDRKIIDAYPTLEEAKDAAKSYLERITVDLMYFLEFAP